MIARRIEAVWRLESRRLIGGLARLTRDVGLAEDLAQDAFLAAMRQWPAEGIPDNPGAWLTAVARRRAIDLFRREKRFADLARDMETLQDACAPEEGEDDLLRLIFTACHPVLAPDSRTALALRMLGGLSTAEIARAYLLPEATIAQRIVRAKKSLAKAGVGFEVPQGEERAARLPSVLEVVYLIFNEGYAASHGCEWMRPRLSEEAMRLGRILAAAASGEAEVHGLLALMEIQASRFAARTDAHGAPILLLDQNRARWDPLLIRRGLAGLARGLALGGEGPYLLQAAIAACHARARTAEETDWAEIAALYARLGEVQPSPIIQLNRAVALGMAFGPAVGLALADALAEQGALEGYHFLPAVRGDLLDKLGRKQEARDAFLQAAALAGNARDRALMLKRAETQ